MFKSRKKLFKESVSSVRNEIRDMFEDIKDGLEAARNAGSDLSDIMVVVETWDQGAPVLVKGAYNYYSGDIRCSADEFVDDHDDLIRDYMKEFDDEVKERNDMLDDILNKMYDDVENGDMDEEDYQEEQMNLIDDTCTWSVSVTLGKGNDEIKSTMAVNIESGDADVLDTDTLSVDEVERWAKKKSESRISRRRGIRRVVEARRSRRHGKLYEVLEPIDRDIFTFEIENKLWDSLPDYKGWETDWEKVDTIIPSSWLENEVSGGKAHIVGVAIQRPDSRHPKRGTRLICLTDKDIKSSVSSSMESRVMSMIYDSMN